MIARDGDHDGKARGGGNVVPELPRRSLDLLMSERQGVEIDHCQNCRGIWLDRGELDKIVERAVAETKVAEPRAPVASLPPAERAQVPWPLACQVAQLPSTATDTGRIPTTVIATEAIGARASSNGYSTEARVGGAILVEAGMPTVVRRSS